MSAPGFTRFQKGISDSGGGAIFGRFVPEDGGILGNQVSKPNTMVQPKIRTQSAKKKTKLRSNMAMGTQSLTRAVRIERG